MDEAIVEYMKQHFSLLIGTQAAEAIKIEAGSAFPLDGERTAEVRGVDTISGVPRKAVVTSEEIREALQRLVPVETLEEGASDASHRYAAFGTLLEPLESIHQPRHSHPEGDVLYHSLQVYELIRGQRPYDIDLQLAALLHDVGKGIDPADHVTAGQTHDDRFCPILPG